MYLRFHETLGRFSATIIHALPVHVTTQPPDHIRRMAVFSSLADGTTDRGATGVGTGAEVAVDSAPAAGSVDRGAAGVGTDAASDACC